VFVRFNGSFVNRCPVRRVCKVGKNAVVPADFLSCEFLHVRCAGGSAAASWRRGDI
jgi:hypothetical protein